ncbi:MAG TPA: sialidase family protein [Pirellulaceae bacterium]|nr:sialidase family protein [Pirellulaceae bacterium]
MRMTILALLALSATFPLAAQDKPQPPIDLGPGNAQAVGINYASAAVTYPDGTLESFLRKSGGGKVAIVGTRSTDSGRTWSEPKELVALEIAPWGGPMPLLDKEGELHFVIPRVRGEGRRPNVDRFIDLYHVRSSEGRTKWTDPQRIYEGYCGALQQVAQLTSGRIIAPFADWLPGVPTSPPTGPSVVTCVYSDDGGKSWQRSPAKLTAPCYDGYNGANYGACEPTIIELKDGRIWMLIRTQAGYLYESFSEDGVNWSEAKQSRFPSSNSPAFPIRLADGRIVVFWNNCVMPPRVDGQGVYAGRDALHAAISDDDGKTWWGFREVYRDPTRNGSPPKSGDRGTAYPHATRTVDGKILLVSGQGENRRRRFLVDPDWLKGTRAEASFENLDEWHVFKGFGPAARFWRDRVAGAQLVDHPDQPGAKALHIRRPDDRDADGASWNFPVMGAGTLSLRIRIEKSFGGARISLADRFYDPCDDQGEEKSPFSFAIQPDGQFGINARLEHGKWHTLEFMWNEYGSCIATLDGKPVIKAGVKELPRSLPYGVSYLRLRSSADKVDAAGFYVDSIHGKWTYGDE